MKLTLLQQAFLISVLNVIVALTLGLHFLEKLKAEYNVQYTETISSYKAENPSAGPIEVANSGPSKWTVGTFWCIFYIGLIAALLFPIGTAVLIANDKLPKRSKYNISPVILSLVISVCSYLIPLLVLISTSWLFFSVFTGICITIVLVFRLFQIISTINNEISDSSLFLFAMTRDLEDQYMARERYTKDAREQLRNEFPFTQTILTNGTK